MDSGHSISLQWDCISISDQPVDLSRGCFSVRAVVSDRASEHNTRADKSLLRTDRIRSLNLTSTESPFVGERRSKFKCHEDETLDWPK